jgi:hypothetical protein
MNASSTDASGNHSAVTTNPNAEEQYILLNAPGQVRVAENDVIYPLHIRGTMTNKGFIPAGNIQGHGKLCDGKDWLSLADLSVHKAADGKTPAAPYVMGCVAANGFQPASRDIVMN